MRSAGADGISGQWSQGMKKQFLLLCAAGLAFCPLGLYANNAKQSAPYIMEEFALIPCVLPGEN